MNTKQLLLLLGVGSVIGIITMAVVYANYKRLPTILSNIKSISTITQTQPSTSLSKNEIDDLLHMREEEKLAHDVYTTLYEKWNVPVFNNIANSESTHTTAIGDLIYTYGLKDPYQSAVGVFTDQKLQTLYTQLIAQGSASLIDALKVGATIEDLDIKDLNEAMKRTTNASIVAVYANLKNGSENHLRSFTGQLTSRAVTYVPQYISPEEYNQIISSSNQQGMNRQGRRGGRRG